MKSGIFKVLRRNSETSLFPADQVLGILEVRKIKFFSICLMHCQQEAASTFSVCLVYGQQDAAPTFNLHGQVSLPRGRDYSQIPLDTCVHIRVQENIQCSEMCDIPVLGSAVIRDFEVVHDKIRYNVTVKRTAVGLYAAR